MIEGSGDPEQQNSRIPSEERKPHSDSKLGLFKAKVRRNLVEEGHFIGSTRETNIPRTEIRRGIVERYERGELFREYMRFQRKIKQAEERGRDSTAIRKEFNEFRKQSTLFKKKLDVLNKQFYPYPNDPYKWEMVSVRDDELGEHRIPVITLDINPPKEGEKDERVPYFIVPVYIGNPYQEAFFAMSLALEGQKVHVMTYPEKKIMAESDEKQWLELLRSKRTMEPYSRLAKKIIENMNLQNINLIGTSMGAEVVLEMAQDPEFAQRINNLVSLEPTSLYERRTLGMLWDFAREAVPGFLGINREESVKAAKSERPELEVSMGRGGGWVEAPFLWAPIIAQKHLTAENLAGINIKGNFQVWTGGDSRITGERAQAVLAEAQKIRSNTPGLTPLQIVEVEKFHHPQLFSTLGIASLIVNSDKISGNFVKINGGDLVHTGAQAILKSL